MDLSFELRDKLLSIICDLQQFEKSARINFESTVKEIGITDDNFRAILRDFERSGLISDLDDRLISNCIFVTRVGARDFIIAGGYTGGVTNLRAEINRLSSEVEELKKSSPSSAEKMTAHLANITTILGFRLNSNSN